MEPFFVAMSPSLSNPASAGGSAMTATACAVRLVTGLSPTLTITGRFFASRWENIAGTLARALPTFNAQHDDLFRAEAQGRGENHGFGFGNFPMIGPKTWLFSAALRLCAKFPNPR